MNCSEGMVCVWKVENFRVVDFKNDCTLSKHADRCSAMKGFLFANSIGFWLLLRSLAGIGGERMNGTDGEVSLVYDEPMSKRPCEMSSRSHIDSRQAPLNERMSALG